MGGCLRLRISSQSLKRAWRTSDVFRASLDKHSGTRTKRLGLYVADKLKENKVSDGDATKWARAIAEQFGKVEKDSLMISQLAHIGPDEWSAVDRLMMTLCNEKRMPKDEELESLRSPEVKASDIALFGRMMAEHVANNVDAAAQVAHAVTTHRVTVEDDYFTAVDDLNIGREDGGAAHIGETEFAAGLFYQYLCIDRELLVSNLRGDIGLASRTIEALLECASTVGPTGKQASFASRARASYIVAEKGNQQPRSLSVAFLKPIDGDDILTNSIQSLETTMNNMDSVYGPCADRRKTVNAVTGEGKLEELSRFAAEM
jgi:CRISPR system Cascade subunit CasC